MVFHKGSDFGFRKEVSVLNKGMRVPEGPESLVGLKNKVVKKKKKAKERCMFKGYRNQHKNSQGQKLKQFKQLITSPAS